jgi:phosphoserine phosphatase
MIASGFSRGISRRLLSSVQQKKSDRALADMLKVIPSIADTNIITTPRPPEYVREVLRELGPGCAVCFDVDSTVITDEGIDMLAEEAGCGIEVKELTSSAMDGITRFEDSLHARLNVIRPSLAMLAKFNERPTTFSPGIQSLVELLQRRGVDVYLVSGGFRQMINPIAAKLGLNASRQVVANNLQFDACGEFSGFDSTEPTSRSGGKAKALQQLREKNNYSKMVMVGDGVTDLEARPPADIMIGFGGVVARPKVQEGADWFVTNFASIMKELD